VEKFAHTLRRIAKPMLIVANKADLPSSAEDIERLKKLHEPQEICNTIAQLRQNSP